MNQTIKVHHVSGATTVIIPTIVFLATMGLFVYGCHSYFDLGNRDLSALAEIAIAIGNIIGGTVAGIIVVVPTHKLLLWLARRKRKALTVANKQIRTEQETFDLSQQHHAEIRSGVSVNGQTMTMVTIRQRKRWLHLSLIAMGRDTTLQYFPMTTFIGKHVVPTEYGIAGYELQKNNEVHSRFMAELLRQLYHNREQNSLHQIYIQFPWSQTAKAQIKFIRQVDENDASVTKIRENATVSGPKFSICEGQVATVTAIDLDIAKTFLLPLGHCTAAIEEHRYSTPTSSAGVAFKQQYRFIVSGRDADGRKIRITTHIMPNDPSEENHIQLTFLCRFINHMASAST